MYHEFKRIPATISIQEAQKRTQLSKLTKHPLYLDSTLALPNSLKIKKDSKIADETKQTLQPSCVMLP
jgi:hypothetical protein